jgi:PAS domain S-box-containing protein
VALGVVDREHRFVHVNDELAAINGLPAAEHCGRTLAEVVPELAPTLLPLYDRVLASGDSIRGIEIEGETPARAGERRFWEASYHPVPGPDGAPEAVIAVIQETTDARREELERVRLQHLVEASSDFVAIGKTDASLVYANPAARRLAGFGLDEQLTGRPWSDFVDADELERFATEILPALEATGTWEGPAVIRNRLTGERTTLEWITFLYADPELGPLVGAIARDQSERRAAEARAIESSRALETLFTLSPVPIFSMDLERTIVRVNRAMEDVFGWPAEEMVGRKPPLDPDQPPEVLTARSALREGRVVVQKFTMRRKDGSAARVIGYGSPQLDGTGAHVGSIGFLIDVEEQEQARERAEQIGRQQQAIAELSLYALGEVPVQAVLDRAAALIADRLGVEHAAALELLPDGGEPNLGAPSSEDGRLSEDDVNFLRAIANVIAATTRRERTNAELRVLTEELEQRVAARTREAEAAREEALQASRAKTEFLSRVSHELRTPLNAIVGFAQLLAMEEVDDERRDDVDQILAGGLHLAELIDELLDISQIEAGRITLKPERVELAALVDEVVTLVGPLAAAKKAVFERAGSTRAPAVADRRRLRQILLNLLSNAIKYNRDGGSVLVTLASADGRVGVEVRDTGYGIAARDVERIFEPFQRLPGAVRTQGTGLGLAVTRALVEAMGGRIRVESEPGVGSCFTVELPGAAPD